MGDGGSQLQVVSYLSHVALWFSLPQKHPEPFFALAKELYPGQFKVRSFSAGEMGKEAPHRPSDKWYMTVNSPASGASKMQG